MTLHLVQGNVLILVWGMIFSQKSYYLQGHVMAHTGERLFSCTKCQKVIHHICWFEQTCQALERQYLLVPNVRPRRGNICLYQMSKIIILKTIRPHTWLRPFVCTKCKKNIHPKWIFEMIGQASHRIEGICIGPISPNLYFVYHFE